MRPEIVLTGFAIGGGLIAMVMWGQLSAPGVAVEVSRRRAGRLFLVLMALVGYLLWERQAALDEACGALGRTFTWTPDPPYWDNGMSLTFDQTQNLSERLPELRTALRVCTSTANLG